MRKVIRRISELLYKVACFFDDTSTWFYRLSIKGTGTDPYHGIFTPEDEAEG